MFDMPPLRAVLDRREALRLIAAGAAASLAACQRPDERIVPAVRQPDGQVPGNVRLYATMLTLSGYARGVTGRVVDARPIKLEGLGSHPASLGATDVFAEQAILDLYDPQRLRAPVGPDGVGDVDTLRLALDRKLAKSDGRGLRLVTGRVTSPTFLARVADLKRRFPAMRHVRFEAIEDDRALAGAQRAHGRRLSMRSRPADADVVIALDADPLGPGPDQIAFARGWADRRRRRDAGQPVLFVLEPSLTATGAMADRRAALHPALIGDALRVLAGGLGVDAGTAHLPAPAAALLRAAQRRLAAATGRAIVIVGRDQPPDVHALAAWVNARLAAPVDWIVPVDPDPVPHRDAIAGLMREMAAGAVDTLMVMGTNPAYHVPGFAAALARVPLSIACGTLADETSAKCRWSLPISHELETWHDALAPDGTGSIGQPLVRPLYGTQSATALLDFIGRGPVPVSDRDRVRRTWAARGAADDRWWTQALVDGVVPGGGARAETVGTPRLVLPREARPGLKLVLTTPPSPSLWDGRQAANGWAQELPDPLTKEVWGPALRLAPADAARLKVADGDAVRIDGVGTVAVRIAAGQAAGVATLPMGGGRRDSGPVADGIGAHARSHLSPAATGWREVVIEAGGGAPRPLSTQGFFALDGDTAKLFPVLAPGAAMPKPTPHPTLLPPPAERLTRDYQWAMAIDTDVCIGCNACVVACQAENNVPVIGPEEVGRHRDMHWLRIDRYDRGDAADPKPGFQPVPCMQCEEAPCEPVCPVEASVHDDQGLNVQVYNRCIGTRTCQANCPYKVRRFNFRDNTEPAIYEEVDASSLQAQRNPDVTVRARGVMEKCTYCVQRIEAARHDADAAGRPIGPVVTACQSACPTRAIEFGDLRDPASAVNARRVDPRHYALLEELGTRPRTTYLARVRDEGGTA